MPYFTIQIKPIWEHVNDSNHENIKQELLKNYRLSEKSRILFGDDDDVSWEEAIKMYTEFSKAYPQVYLILQQNPMNLDESWAAMIRCYITNGKSRECAPIVSVDYVEFSELSFH